MDISTLTSTIGQLFTVYLFGTTPIGITLAWIFTMAIFVVAAYKFGLGGDAILLVVALVGMFSGVFMFENLALKAIVGFAMGLLVFLALARLMRR